MYRILTENKKDRSVRSRDSFFRTGTCDAEQSSEFPSAETTLPEVDLSANTAEQKSFHPRHPAVPRKFRDALLCRQIFLVYACDEPYRQVLLSKESDEVIHTTEPEHLEQQAEEDILRVLLRKKQRDKVNLCGNPTHKHDDENRKRYPNRCASNEILDPLQSQKYDKGMEDGKGLGRQPFHKHDSQDDWY